MSNGTIEPDADTRLWYRADRTHEGSGWEPIKLEKALHGDLLMSVEGGKAQQFTATSDPYFDGPRGCWVIEVRDAN